MGYTGIIPENMRDKMQPTDRADIGKAAMTNADAQAKQDGKRERDLQEQIRKYCQLKEWVCFHGGMHKATTRTVGENDFHCLLPGSVVLFIECKTATGKLSEAQEAMRLRMATLGHTMHIVRSLGEFITLAKQALRTLPSQ